MDGNRPMTPEQVAEHWGCSANHVRNLVKRGELEAFKLGLRLIRITPQAVRDYEERQSNKPRQVRLHR